MAQVIFVIVAKAFAASVGWGFIATTAITAAAAYAGAAVDRMLFGSKVNVQGPRLNDLSIQTSNEGASLPIVYGTMRIAGNVIWSTGLTEASKTEESGGDGSGGGGGSSHTTYTYSTDCAVALCEGTISGIRRIWADSKLIYNVGSNATLETLQASNKNNIRFYTGSETQLCDPLIQAVQGTDLAYRGTAYVVFEDFQLADYSNRLPNFSFEVVKNGSFNSVSSSPLTDVDINNWYIQAIHSGMFHFDGTFAYYVVPLKDVRLDPYNAIQVKRVSIIGGVFGQKENVRIEPYTNYWGIASGISDTLQYGLRAMWATTQNPFNQGTTGGYSLYYAIRNDKYYLSTSNGLTRHTISSTMPVELIYQYPFAIQSYTSALWWGCAVSNKYAYFGITKDTGEACILKYEIDGTFISSFTNNGMSSFSVTEDDELFVVIGTILYSTKDFFSTLTTFSNISGYTTEGRGNYVWSLIKINPNTVLIGSTRGNILSLSLFNNYTGKIANTNPTLKSVADDIISKTALPSNKVNFTALGSDTIRGYASRTSTNAANMIEPLITGYNFDLVEENGTLVAKKRGNSISSRTINSNDLGATIDG